MSGKVATSAYVVVGLVLLVTFRWTGRGDRVPPAIIWVALGLFLLVGLVALVLKDRRRPEPYRWPRRPPE